MPTEIQINAALSRYGMIPANARQADIELKFRIIGLAVHHCMERARSDHNAEWNPSKTRRNEPMNLGEPETRWTLQELQDFIQNGPTNRARRAFLAYKITPDDVQMAYNDLFGDANRRLLLTDGR